ncbi:hypothetical protein HCB33_14180 [Listeria sp. FSL L7-0233]|uniref:DUF5592 family protein n=1 Tax=Listeria cossartiae subsp. cayugensis TaxID=2713505 RepID=A0A7X0ZES0_9LIST|nr:DUF5592 family protein [Listeria cossartiae]MBC2184505.1 hypothetical protein [Listeria cossartiae subsp. cossartiae]MBC2251122.1 hypothetical protein [Listeria cossartiae subsp. cayugensis]MDT0067295.1 DUF5592 family protein [Listeria cossartiae subsp. cayugensis]MDT0081142.1 DUF5592 family protein [Listeria cossartiae subsp. cayugensis]MDT0083978.1 DUF5592 family protein [Listeria cossartiae subsp. cayugensis]
MKIEQSYDIQKSIQTKTKVKGLVDFQDVLLVFLYFMLLSKIKSVFPPQFAMYIIVLNVGVMVFWTWRSKANYKMKHGQTLFRVLFKRSRTYHAIDSEGNSYGGRRKA